MTERFFALRAVGFTVEQARALAAAGYGVVAWVPFGWVPVAGGR